MEDGQIPRKIWQVPHFVAALISSDLELTAGTLQHNLDPVLKVVTISLTSQMLLSFCKFL